MSNKFISLDAVVAKIEDKRLKRPKGALSVEYALCDILEYIEKLPVYDVDKLLDSIFKDYRENVDTETGEPCENWVVDMINEYTIKHYDIVASELKHFKNTCRKESKYDSMSGLSVCKG